MRSPLYIIFALVCAFIAIYAFNDYFSRENVSVEPVPEVIAEDPIIDENISTTTSLVSRTWTWESAQYGGESLIAPNEASAFTLSFLDDGSFSATTDCNSMGGSYVSDGVSLSFSDIFSTKKFCEGSQENYFLQVINDTESYTFAQNGNLILGLKGEGSAIFK